MKSNLNRMTLASAQGTPPTNYPKTLLSIVSYVGGLAVFLLIASSFLASQPNESSVRGHFYGVDSSRKVINDGIVTGTTNQEGSDVGTARKFNTDGTGVDQGNKELRNSDSSASHEKESDADDQHNDNGGNGDNKHPSEPQDKELPDSEQGETAKSSPSTPGLLSEGNVVQAQHNSVTQGNRYENDSTLQKGKKDETLPSSDSNLDAVTSSSPATTVEPHANSGLQTSFPNLT